MCSGAETASEQLVRLLTDRSESLFLLNRARGFTQGASALAPVDERTTLLCLVAPKHLMKVPKHVLSFMFCFDGDTVVLFVV